MKSIRTVAAVAGLCALASVLAACGSATPTGAPSTAPASAVAESPATTTTLPPAFGIPGTSPLGSLQSLGPIERVAVLPPPPGRVVAPTATATDASPPPSEKIAFRQFGSGPDLVLIAGEHATITSWDPKFVANLGQHYRVTLFDPPGIGYSGPGLTTASIRSYADTVAGLANALGLVTPIAVGWGLGGGVVLSLVERHPGLFAGAVLINSTVGAPHESVSPAAAAVLGSSQVTPAILSRLYFPPSAEAARLAWLERTSDVSPDTIVTNAVNAEAVVQQRAEQDQSLLAGLKSIAIPVLVMTASGDTVTPPADGRVIANEIPHATYVLIRNGGYACFAVAETEVLNSIGSFVSATLAA